MARSPRYQWLITNIKAGGYQLPPAVLTAYAEVDRLCEHAIPEPAVVDAVGDAAAQLRQEARSGSKLLTRVPGLAKYEADVAQARAAQAALDQATVEAQLDWEAEVIDGLDVIITMHLAPVHAQVVADARELWPKIASITTPTDAVSADDDTRAAYLRFEELAVQLGVLIDTASRTNQAGETRPQHPEFASHYSAVKNPATVWDDFSRLQHQVLARATGPWAGTSRDRLAWLAATPAADSWLPTYGQVNELVNDRHADEFAARQRGLAGGRAQKAWRPA
jgi:hypothetical protein